VHAAPTLGQNDDDGGGDTIIVPTGRYVIAPHSRYSTMSRSRRPTPPTRPMIDANGRARILAIAPGQQPDGGCGTPANNQLRLTQPEDRMTSQLTYLIVQQRHAELVRRAEHARLANGLRSDRRASSPRWNIARLLRPRRLRPAHPGSSCEARTARTATRVPEVNT
jgi:hypothetical protein